MRFRSDIQGLRAVAVLPVLMFHFGMSLVPGGFTGVDVFFCISGFVIAGSVLNDLRDNRFSIADFYFKRIRRIFPALGAVLLATTIAAWIVFLPDTLVGYSESLFASGTFWSNIYFWKASGYFSAAAQTQPLLHTWSLSIEEQFYVVAPIGLALIHRYGRECWLRFLLPIVAISFLASIAAVFTAPTAGFFLLPSRAWELLFGAMLALHGRDAPNSALAREAMAWLGIALIVSGVVMLDESAPFPGWNALLPCVGAALIIHSGKGVTRLPFIGRALSVAPMQFIGNISYSLYLIHWPIAALSRYATLAPPGPGQTVAMFALSVGLATLCWRYVEEPWRHIEHRYRARVLLAGAAMMVLVMAAAVLGVITRGAPGRYPGYVHRTTPGTEQWGGAHCFGSDPTRPLPWDAAACTRIHGRHGRILLWGDSFAAQYAPGIIANSRRIDADVLQYTFAGCPPILAYSSLARVGCATSNRAVFDVIRDQHIDTVVLSARWTETPRRTLLRLSDTIAVLRHLGLRVFVFGQSPQFAADTQQIDFITGNYNEPRGARWTIAFDPSLNALIGKQAKHATFVDPLAMLCRGRTCPYRLGVTFLYADYGHFSAAGSAIAVRRYFPLGQLPGKATASQSSMTGD